jgi:transcriptional regulator with XRE-family HTH domain
MEIGDKIKQLRIRNGLTQEELAKRVELTKGFISQLERDLTSPSISTLVDILECLGTTIKDFFNETVQEKIVFRADDFSEARSRERGTAITWLVPNAQKNLMEPILLTLEPGASSDLDEPHEGEEFGFVVSGIVSVHLGKAKYKAKKGESFCFKSSEDHYLVNEGKKAAVILWISSPPSF